MPLNHHALILDDATYNSNASFDGSGSIADLVPTHATNSRAILEIRATAKSDTSANMLRIYLHNGTAYIPYHELPVSPIAPGAAALRWSAVFRPVNLVIPSTWKVGVSAHTIGASPSDEFFIHADVDEIA